MTIFDRVQASPMATAFEVTRLYAEIFDAPKLVCASTRNHIKLQLGKPLYVYSNEVGLQASFLHYVRNRFYRKYLILP